MSNGLDMTSSLTRARPRDMYADPAAGGPRRIRRARHAPAALAPIDEALARLHGYRSLISRLTPHQWAEIRAHDGPERLGDPGNGPRYAV